MKTNFKLALAALAGVSIGAAGTRTTHAQQTKTPSAYVISEADTITDLASVQKYGAKVGETLAPFKDHYHFVVGGGKAQSLEGEAPKGIVVIAFDNADQAHAWYDSPAYQEIKPLRQSGVKGRIFIVEGAAAQQ